MPQPSSTTAYQQVTQWVQAWQTVNMAKPLQPVNDTDASNNGIEKQPDGDQTDAGNDGIQKPVGLEPGSQPAPVGPASGDGGSTGVDTYA